jgi:hypothetical protein
MAKIYEAVGEIIWCRKCKQIATSWKVMGSILDEVAGFFNVPIMRSLNFSIYLILPAAL